MLLEVERSMSVDRARDLRSVSIRLRGMLGRIRSNASKFIATRLRQSLKATQIETLRIDLNSPWQDGRSGLCNGHLRDGMLNAKHFVDLLQTMFTAFHQRDGHNLRTQSVLRYAPLSTSR